MKRLWMALVVGALMAVGGASFACSGPTNQPEGVTLKELKQMSDKEAIAFGTCQSSKVIEDLGQEGSDKYFKDYTDYAVNTGEGEEIISVQEYMLRDGYTCTREEMKNF